MILVVGGAFQGKKEYAMRQFGIPEEAFADLADFGAVDSDCVTEDDCSSETEALRDARAADHLHRWIRSRMEAGDSPEKVWSALERFLADYPDIILLIDEIGCGVIPMDPFERDWRECCGRIGCRLAEQADEVHRVICGIGQRIR